MKAPKTFSEKVRQCQYPFYTVIFSMWTWSTWHEKKFHETALYSVALVASIFLSILQLRDWDVTKGRLSTKRQEYQEETKPWP